MKPRLSLERCQKWIESARTHQAATMRLRSARLRIDNLDPVAAFALFSAHRIALQQIERRRIRLATEIRSNDDE